MPDSVESFGEAGRALASLRELISKQVDLSEREFSYIRAKLETFEKESRQEYIRKDTFDARFKPIERIVYVIVILIVTAVVTAVIDGVLK